MKYTKFLSLFLFVFVLSISSVYGACTYTYNNQGGSDYFGINIHTDNISVVPITQLWTDWDYFTPRLNFTRVVNESIVGGVVNANSQFAWYFHDNKCNETLVIKNGSNTVDVSNYTYIWINQTSGSAGVKWTDAKYNGTSLVFTCNRTFTKNVDDIIFADTTINKDYDRSYWLTENTPTEYGDYKTFRFDNNFLGLVVNNSNWAVGWNYTEVTCTVGETGCSAGASNLWGTLVLIVIAGFLLYLVTVFFEGNVTIAIIIYVAIVATLIPWLIDILNLGC